MKKTWYFVIYLIFAEVVLLVIGIYMQVSTKDLIFEMLLSVITFGVGFLIAKLVNNIRKYAKVLKWINDPITQQALLTIGGKYGEGQDRVDALTSKFSHQVYEKIQERVNQLMIENSDASIEIAKKYIELQEEE